MDRLDEVRKEIEQLCEEIERDAARSHQHPAAGNKVAPAPPVNIRLVLSGKMSRMRLKISFWAEGNDEDS